VRTRVSDPSLEYWTLETARFHIHYEKGLEPVAVRVAELCESIHAELSASMGHVPDQITEVVHHRRHRLGERLGDGGPVQHHSPLRHGPRRHVAAR
jgi:hypothetical protein